MLAFLKYQRYKAKHKPQFLIPYFFYILFIVFVYSYSGAESLSSYTLTSIGLFAISVWLGIQNSKSELLNEKYIVLIQLTRASTYVIGKLIFIITLNLPLIFIALIYPLIFNKFIPTASLNEVLLGLYAHISAIILGTLIGSFALVPKIKHLKYLYLMAFLLIVLTILKPVFINLYPFTKYVLWILPTLPDLEGSAVQLLFSAVTISFYSFIIFLILVYLFKHSEE
ncbi:hypothetical protein [Staphylococcus carnosus]|uniref:ABC transporter, permease n=2 Tax=Staphylococcus carnosus TaxID=1281 RepID=B9DLE0_STACT|nr:hypothetical protein [Staphylococcus carnosus]ANZ34205.1 hypothetical protein BEK99_10690 [Staphylococcus carnosus]QPT03246.1 hypothetical protein I6G40_09065 [Staphylococcus carnosus]UQA68249.1 hypothetical protein Sta3580_05095 [Staphylococcus carnosus]UTB79191.1 hypothetical protein A2I62_11800 [Staphylococcus carnosus]UTB81573.1 hypothetical protein A2I65_12075 [Staphylococcus carnosus]